MENTEYEQKGYLDCSYRLFHINDKSSIDTPYHYHSFDKIIFFIGGNAKYIIEGREYTLEPYDIVLVNRYDIHRAVAYPDSNYDRYILYIDHDFLMKYSSINTKSLAEDCSANSVTENYDNSFCLADCFNEAGRLKNNVIRFPAAISAGLLDRLRLLERDTAAEKSAYAGELVVKCDLVMLMVHINAACRQEKLAFHPEARYNSKIIDIIEYISENLKENLSIDDIADSFYISKYYMMRLFKADTGYSIHQYITEKRILLARDLILKGESATNACSDCGFNDYSSFCRAYKRQLGILPSEQCELLLSK